MCDTFWMNTSELRGPPALLAFLVAALFAAYLAFVLLGVPAQGERSSGAEIADFVPEPPSPEVVAQLEQSSGFEFLVSYTDQGFEPGEAVIERGQSVRFTNNSSGVLWVAAVGDDENPRYPGLGDCGASFFDTCTTLAPNEFWEFTFQESGTWAFQNNADKGKTGIVRVLVH